MRLSNKNFFLIMSILCIVSSIIWGFKHNEFLDKMESFMGLFSYGVYAILVAMEKKIKS